MKLLVIGGGGREHAIVKKLRENPAVEVIYCLPGNGRHSRRCRLRAGDRREGHRRAGGICKGPWHRLCRSGAG